MRYALIMLVLVAGCGHTPPAVESIACAPIDVGVPVITKAPAPEALLNAERLRTPSFVEPSAIGASSCVTAVEEQVLLDYADTCATQLEAWRAWAEE